MATNSNWPLTATNIAFSGDPFDQNATPVWTDVSRRAQDFSASVGKQYELDTTQAGEATYTMLDSDEKFNPSNPYSPYRQGNLLVNLAYDPTFDSYTAGTTPSWTTGVGVTPTISTTNPFSGANDLAFTTSVSGTPQGFTFTATSLTVGYNYSCTAYVRKETGTDNVRISVQGGATGTTLSSNAAYVRLVVQFTATATSHIIQILTTAGPTGANIVRTDSIQLETGFAPTPFASSAASTNVKVYRRIADQTMWPPVPVGGATNLLNTTSGYDPSFESYTPGSSVSWILPFNTTPTVTTTNPFQGTQCLTFAMLGNSTEQGVGLQFNTIPNQSYLCSLYVRQTAANTMQLFINGGAAGDTTSTAGSYVRLTVQWTAIDVTSQLYVASFSPTLASTVNIDAIQVEPILPLNANTDFTNGTSNWTPTNATLSVSTLWSTSHQYSLAMTATGGFAQAFAENDQTAVTAGTLYKVQGTIYSPVGSGSFVAGVRVDWFDNAHTYLTTSISGESALTAGVPLVVGYTATAPVSAAFASVQLSLTGSPTAGTTIYADDLQLFSQAPTAFSTSGPVIYGVFRGYVERWPSSWNYQGTYGLAEITCVDAFAPMAGQILWTEFRNALLAKLPIYYWPLSEGSTATLFAEASGNNGPNLQEMVGPNGGGTITPGTQMNIVGDPSGTGLQFAVGTSGIYTNWLQPAQNINIALSGTSWGCSFGIWFSQTTAGSGQVIQVGTSSTPSSNNRDSAGILFGSTGSGWNFTLLGAVSSVTASTVNNYADGLPHFMVITASLSAAQITVQMWVDATLAGSNTVAANTVFSSSTPTIAWNTMAIQGGALVPGSTQTNGMPGNISHLCVFNYALAFGDVNNLRSAGSFGFSGETSGARLTRYLSYHYIAPSALDTGASTMNTSNLASNTSLLDACQNVTTSENGDLFVDPNGNITFQSRTHRYLSLTPSWIFGENQAAGEIPYNGDINFDYDPTQVFNDVVVDNAGGIKAPGGTPPAIAASQKKYGKRSYSRTVNVSDLEAQDAANWLFAAHQDPVQRLNQITINPAANPSLWAAALGIKIGDRVTVRRRTTAFTQQADFFIERKEHSRAPGQWLVTFQMSPATFAVNLQPGIFDNTTYGIFDQSMIFGY